MDEEFDDDLDNIIDLDEQTNVEQPKRYKTGSDEEEYPGDLEKLNSESYLDEEDSGFTSSKTKTLYLCGFYVSWYKCGTENLILILCLQWCIFFSGTLIFSTL